MSTIEKGLATRITERLRGKKAMVISNDSSLAYQEYLDEQSRTIWIAGGQRKGKVYTDPESGDLKLLVIDGKQNPFYPHAIVFDVSAPANNSEEVIRESIEIALGDWESLDGRTRLLPESPSPLLHFAISRHFPLKTWNSEARIPELTDEGPKDIIVKRTLGDRFISR